MPKTKVKQDPENPVQKEVLAEAIVEISKAMKKLLSSGLNRRAIVVLIKDSVPSPGYGKKSISKTDIINVLDAIEDLSRNYC